MQIALPDIGLPGDLALPALPRGLVVFVHGSGSSRHSSRNRFVAAALAKRGFATLLFDLLSEREDLDEAARFDIELLTRRLLGTCTWIRGEARLAALPLNLFGASTGAAAALAAAAELDDGIAAVVSRGGRPDLVLPLLPRVTSPTLLIVGGADDIVIQLNRKAYAALRAPKELAIVPGATHLFEEPGALERVAELAGDWFERHGVGRQPPRSHP
ncbi:dienelactone hydrolase family protein [Solimonas variicoloris]|uniref:dienelactone hydrolase family protein n=1 Tax=Solimonas variicoloris TaxID=254408 RepID=UPI00036401B7|nr:dienelactone hydrolase family protein [Solimonas variicoloris]